jgi:hypothetical protein
MSMDKMTTTIIIMVMSTITTGMSMGMSTIMSINMNMGLGTMNTPTHKKNMADGAWNFILARPLTLHDHGQ